MRNATTVRIFAALIGFVLAWPAAAQAQNSHKVTTSCGSASTLGASTSPAFNGFGKAVVSSSANIQASEGPKCDGVCVSGSSFCLGAPTGSLCEAFAVCQGVRIKGSSGCDCSCVPVARGGPPCHPRNSKQCS